MAETIFRGPAVALGATMDTSISPTDGPSMNYQGGGFLDPRYQQNKDSIQPGALQGFLQTIEVQVIDNIPSTLSSTSLATAQVATSGTAFTLVGAAPGGSAAGVPSFAPGMPIIPSGTTSIVTVSAIDFGFTTGTTAANSSTVVVVDSTLFDVGQWIGIGGAGNTGKTAGLITQVTTLTNATTIKVSPVCVGALDNAPIGQANLFQNNTPPGTQFGPANASANAIVPYQVAGASILFDPVQALARNITMAAASTEGGTATILVTGYDIYGVAMTELLTAAGTTIQQGKKAFKYISNITPSANGSSAYVVGVGDIFGLPIRSDRFGQIGQVSLGNFKMSTAAGWTAAITSAANNTTGDVRGTLSITTLGGAAGSSNGALRLTVVQTIPLLAAINASPSNSTSLFGVLQA